MNSASTSQPPSPTAGSIRAAAAERDASVCRGVYAPSVRDTAVSFEEEVPSVDEFEGRIRKTTASYPWLGMELDGRVVGYAYATQHRPRAAYRWTVEVTVYIDRQFHRAGIGRRLYTE